VPNVLHTLRGKPVNTNKTSVPAWMLAKDVDKDDQSVAGWIQRVKNTLFGGLQADIFEVRSRACACAYVRACVRVCVCVCVRGGVSCACVCLNPAAPPPPSVRGPGSTTSTH
jgi:hypothetical protein